MSFSFDIADIPPGESSDNWKMPVVTTLKAVTVDNERCSQTAKDVFGLSKNLLKDPFCEDETELRLLYSKPTCFLFLGKPGVGKTSLARRFAAEWKCELINSTDLIMQNIELQTDFGIKCNEILTRGEAIPEDMVLKLIEEKINSPEVAHHGYVMDDFPCLCEDLMSIKDQLELIKSWKLAPDFVINIRIPDQDIEQRRLGQKLDPLTGEIYTKSVYAPEKPVPVPIPERDEEEEEEDDEVEDDEEPEENGEPIIELPLDILERLIIRPEDIPNQVEENLGKYKSNALRILEDYMADHDQQYLVEMDGNQKVVTLFKQLMMKLSTFVLRPAAVVTRIIDQEDEELPEDMETEELLRALGPKMMVAPRYRWRRSRWLRYCPVALFEGNILPGKPEFAVSFLDKVYCLSSADALEKFVKNPRPYLLPTQPRPPCKIAVIGPRFCGKTTLSNLLAHKYGAKVLCVDELTREKEEEEKRKNREHLRLETTEKAIQQVKAKIQEKLDAEAAAREEERLALLAAESAREQEEKEQADKFGEEGESTEGEDNTKKEEVEESDGKPKPSSVIMEAEETEKQHGKDGEEGGEGEEEGEEGEENAKKASEGEQAVPDGSSADTSATPAEEVDEFHPEVMAIVEKVMAETGEQEVHLSPEVQVEVLDGVIKAWEKEMRNRWVDGPLYGRWVLDNFPRTREQWNACMEKNLLPDDVIVLGDMTDSAKSPNIIQALAERYCIKNKSAIIAQMEMREEIRLENERKVREEKRQGAIEEAKKALLRKQQKQGIDTYKLLKEGHLENLDLDELQNFNIDDLPNADDFRLMSRMSSDDFSQFGALGPTGMPVVPGLPGTSEDLQDLDEEMEGEGEEEGEEEDSRPSNEDALTFEHVPTPEPEPLKTEIKALMEQPEMIEMMERFKEDEKDQISLLATITGSSSIVPFFIEAINLSPDDVLANVIKHLERLFKYFGWEMGAADLDEEEEDLEAETAEAVEDEAGDEEEAEEEEEDPNRSIKRKFLGDANYFDPVSLKETEILVPGNPEIAAIYREKIYYFTSNESREKFLENPLVYLKKDEPLKAPPLRLLILGAKGSGKTLHGRNLAEKLGIFHISFRERLQELIIAKTKKKIGPEYEELDEELDNDNEEDSDDEENDKDTKQDTDDEEMKEDVEKNIASAEASKGDMIQPPTIPEEEEEELPELTEDEEAIKANLESNDPLPHELLDNILAGWWNKEPFKSTGFILEGFPRSSEEVRYLQEAGLFPDAAIILQVSDEDVVGRLLPPKLDKWKAKRDKRLAKKERKREKARKKREAIITKRREELIKEREEKREAKLTKRTEPDHSENEEEDVEEEEEEEEDEEDDIEAILAEEFEEEEEEEEEEDELEEDAVERMKNDFNEIYDDDANRLAVVEETLEECLIPRLDITAGRKPHIVRYIMNKKLKPYIDFRHSLFERLYPLTESRANIMLQRGYKQPSRFGRWDPVKLKEGDCIQPMSGQGYPVFPCFYRSHVYFLSSQKNRQMFMTNAMTYLKQETPKPVVPIKIAIIGPPKSGKTTLANRFVEDYGVMRLSIGEAMRQVLAQQPKSDLAKRMNWHLHRGRVVPDELQVLALETAMLEMRCQIRGYVLDGFPNTRQQIDLMNEHSIIPVRVIELELDPKEVMVRGVKDRMKPNKGFVCHDSSQILAIKQSCFNKTVGEVRDWYTAEHHNLKKVAADQSKWWLWDTVHDVATASVRRIQDYLQRTGDGKSACIADLCITPSEFDQRVGDFSHYCPVSLAEFGELVDCSINPTLQFAAEFRGHYYKMASQKELDMFLADPEKYVPPLAPKKLPPTELLPKRISASGLNNRAHEIQGYCPVTYLDGKLRYEAIKPGSNEFMVEYKDKIYVMESEEKLYKFMKLPEMYAGLKLPHKLPPKVEELPLVNMPMLGFMEQTCAVAMIKALTAAGNAKPKYPFISSTRSALIYIAYHLKAYNPKSSPYIRKKYKQKLKQFEETCELIKYLGNNMTVRYRDPNERPKDFDSKLETFFALRGTEPTPTWIT